MGVTLILTSIIGFIGALFCWYHKRRLDYWRNTGVPHIKAVPLLGNMLPMAFRKSSWPDRLEHLYNKISREPKYIGLFHYTDPVIMVRDPRIIKHILSDNFANFSDHPVFPYEMVQPLMSRSVYKLRGDTWKEMREIVTPIFTPQNLSVFVDLIERTAKDFAQCLETLNTSKVDIRDAFARYTVDVMITSVFGYNDSSLMNEKKFFTDMTMTIWERVNRFTWPLLSKLRLLRPDFWLSRKLNDIFTPLDFYESTSDQIRRTIATREERGIRPGGLIDLLMTAQDNETGAHELNVDDITAQAFVFFLKSLPTTVSLSFLTYDIAKNRNVQRKLQNEIDRVLSENDLRVDYEVLQNMKYLDMVLCESMRMHTPIPIVERVCTKPYTLPPALPNGRPFTVPAGMILWIPVKAIQNDKKYFPDPGTFNPERFAAENKHNLQPFTYLPWGWGPRHCFGSEYAKLQMKMIIVHLLSRFNFNLTPEMSTRYVMPYDESLLLKEYRNGLRLCLERRTA